MKPDTIGWLLFTASAAAFTVSSLKSGDPAALLGSLLFLIACGFFMWPQAARVLARRRPD